MNFFNNIFKPQIALLILTVLIFSCEQQDTNNEIININNEFIKNNLEQRMNVTLLDLDFYEELNTTNKILRSIEQELKQGENITNRLDSLIAKWKSNFDTAYSTDYFERVDRSFNLFKRLDDKKDTNQVKNLFYMMKYEMLNRYLVDITGPCYSMRNHKIIPIIESSKIPRVGEEIELNFYYGIIDSLTADKIYIGGYHNNEFRSDLITDTVVVDNGIGNYKFMPKKAGDTLVEGVIEIRTMNGPIHYPFSQTIKVY